MMQSRIFLTPVQVAIRFVVSRPVAFWINAALVTVWLYLLWPLLRPVYLNPTYVIYLTTLTLPVLAYAYLALVGGRLINIGLLIACVFCFALGEIYLRLRILRQSRDFRHQLSQTASIPTTCSQAPQTAADG